MGCYVQHSEEFIPLKYLRLRDGRNHTDLSPDAAEERHYTRHGGPSFAGERVGVFTSSALEHRMLIVFP
jgi:hypothetical protein